MTDLVDATDIERIVGVPRHATLHLGRAVTAECRVYILHSEECRQRNTDLRACAYSFALDHGEQGPEYWPLDQPLTLSLDVQHGLHLTATALEDTCSPSERVLHALAAGSFAYTDETSLQVEITTRLWYFNVAHRVEMRLDERNRIDFLTDDGVGIEVKVAGSLDAVTRQLTRYAAAPEVRALVLVTTIAKHRAVPTELGGKPVHLHSLIGQGL